MTAVAVGGALILMSACGGGAEKSNSEEDARSAAAAEPSVKTSDMVKSEAAATKYLSITSMQSYGAGCVNAYQCQAALAVLQPYVPPLAEALDEEAGSDPYYKDLVDLADKVSKGVQYTEPADNGAMDALLKDVVKLKEQLQEKDLGHL